MTVQVVEPCVMLMGAHCQFQWQLSANIGMLHIRRNAVSQVSNPADVAPSFEVTTRGKRENRLHNKHVTLWPANNAAGCEDPDIISHMHRQCVSRLLTMAEPVVQHSPRYL